MDELDFEFQWANYKRMYGDDSDFAFAEAAKTHSLVAINRLRNCNSKLHILLGKLSNFNSQKYLAYGAMRRLLMVENSYRSIRDVCHHKRTEPLSSEDRCNLDRDINMVYINIRGILDNLAWSYLYEKDLQLLSEIDLKKNKMRIGLFSKHIRQSSTQNFWTEINNRYGGWASEFSSKRDPIAHGLPMYIIPKFYENEDQRILADKLDQDAIKAVLNNEFDKAESYRLQSQRLGVFSPCFCSDPTVGYWFIYPAVSMDLSNLIRIIEFFETEIKS